jgi:hypothetical protein
MSSLIHPVMGQISPQLAPMYPSADYSVSASSIHSSFPFLVSRSAEQLRNENFRDCFSSTPRFDVSVVHHALCDTVSIIADTRSTSINATWFALTEYAQSPTILIVGGETFSHTTPQADKQKSNDVDFSIIDADALQSVECIIVYGSVAPAYFQHFSGLIRCICVDTLSAAVRTASDYIILWSMNYSHTHPTILFSASTPVHGDFINPAHRCAVFHEAIAEYLGIASVEVSSGQI